MLAIERKNEILDKLRAEQRVLVSDLAAYYHVTEETIRRDLDKLEKEGYATKTYGGAILGNSTKTDLSYTIRNKTNVEAKNQIAAIASHLIEDGDHLMLDDSSTSLYLAKKLKEKKNLTVITNSVELVVELSDVEGWTILLTGGRLKPESLALVGDQTQQALRRYHVDKAVMSCKGIDLESGVTDSSEFHSQTKQSMLRCAKTRILILDSSKFDKISFIDIAPLDVFDTIVTNAAPSTALNACIRARNKTRTARLSLQPDSRAAACSARGSLLFFSCSLRLCRFLLFHQGHTGQNEEDPYRAQQAERSVKHVIERQRHPQIACQHEN